MSHSNIIESVDTTLFRVIPYFNKNKDLIEFIDDSITTGKIVTVLDTETTGMNRDDNELFMLSTIRIMVNEYLNKFKILSYSTYYNRPSIPIPVDYQESARVSDETIDSNQITSDQVIALNEQLQSSTIVCHNAKFDRWFVRKLYSKFGLEILDDKNVYYCSNSEVDWKGLGYTSSSLYNILDSKDLSIKNQWHSAIDDCYVTLYVLFHKLLNNIVEDDKEYSNCISNLFSLKPQVQIIAHNTSYSKKDIIKEYRLDNNRFSWNPELTAWTITVNSTETVAVVKWLMSSVYAGTTIKPIMRTLDLSSRFR